MSDVFRKCASAVVVRPSTSLGSEMEVLLVHKPRKNDSWQLPQGGIEEGETKEQAVVRELQEETSLVAVAGETSSIEYQYEFPSSYRRFRPDSVCGQRVYFVHVMLDPPNQAVVVDENEIDAYEWVEESELHKYIKRKEYRAIVEQLIDEAKQA